MKRLSYILFVLLVLLFTTCQKKPQLKVYKLELTEETVSVTPYSATITANYSYPGEIPYVKLLLSTFGDMTGAVEYNTEVSDNIITATLDNLNENTRYYYLFRYSNGMKLVDTEIQSLMTEGYTLPVVFTGDITDITSNSAYCSGDVTSAGNGTISAKGICYGTNNNPSIYNNVINCGDSLGMFETMIDNLDINTLYYIRAFATNEKGTAYGEQKSFTTLGQVPTMVTIPITQVTSNTAVSGGSINDNGGNAVIEKGVCWSTQTTPTVKDPHTSDGAGNNAYISNLADLLPNTKYYVRAFATNSQGTGYGNELTFTTTASLPRITTKSVSDITESSAKTGGNIKNDGGMSITTRGVCWSTTHNPTINDQHTTDGSGIGEFDSEIVGLNANVKYYVRAYATNDYGTAYGDEHEFTTVIGSPSVTTSSVTSITASSAICGGNVTNSGGGTITARGVCWATSQNPTINDNHTSDGTGTGEFTSSITGLTNNVTYYVRAYATNSNGTAYGEERSFITQEGLAVVTTADITNITNNSAVSGGSITDDGGFSITERGVCWSTSQNPTTSDAHTSDGTGTGSYTSQLSSLSNNTTYYVRAYATNSKGTSYGEEKTFSTNKIAPTVTTTAATSITANSAVCGGNVTSDGGANVTARGVCYGTSQNPTISGLHTTDGNGTGIFTSSLTGLAVNTTYYVRAYATNSEGTNYGDQKTFTTLQNIVIPSVTTNNITNISTTSATCGGNVTSAGYGTVSARGVCWSTSQNPTISNSHTTDGNGTGTFSSSISGLTENTTYYVRAYATNEAGTAYGEQKSFTTPSYIVSPTVSTNNVTNISTTSATCGGNVTSEGNGTVSAKGVCWSTTQYPTLENSHTNDGIGIGPFTSSITGLTENTTYYVRAYATNETGTSFGLQVSFTTEQNSSQIPTGAINGLFTINANGDQVYFSQGNLQYQASTNTWRFAENQWNFVGSMGDPGNVYENSEQCINNYISSSYSGWIDLFGWGTSGYNHGAVCYQPWSISETASDYYAYGSQTSNLYDQTGQADWGYNTINNGGNTINTWRTLTQDEWIYIFLTRTTQSGMLFAKGRIVGISPRDVNGVILFPDNWNQNTYTINNYNNGVGAYEANSIAVSDWQTLESAGAIFLPTTGFRTGGTFILNCFGQGVYWSSTNTTNEYASSAFSWTFFDGNSYGSGGGLSSGYAVRLVKDY